MLWLKLGIGAACALVGIAWLGQGLNLIRGSFMTGQPQWAVIGGALLVVAVWLVWSAVRGAPTSHVDRGRQTKQGGTPNT